MENKYLPYTCALPPTFHVASPIIFIVTYPCNTKIMSEDFFINLRENYIRDKDILLETMTLFEQNFQNFRSMKVFLQFSASAKKLYN